MPQPSPALLKRAFAAGRIALPTLAIVALVVALAGGGYWALRHFDAGRAATSGGTSQPAPALAAGTIGWVDAPPDDAVLGPRVRLAGWALDAKGIRAVEIRLDDRAFAAAIGIARPDVAATHPGYPDTATAGFTFTGDFSSELAGAPSTQRRLTIVAITRDGRETLLATKRLISASALARWSPLLDERPALAARRTSFLMMTSGVAAGGASGIDTAYTPYFTRTAQLGFAVPILYLRTTTGAAGDWTFDPAFDVARKCGERAVADDALGGVIRHAIERQLPVQFILNGGIWADAPCDAPEWDVNDHLEQDVANCQWTQRDQVPADDVAQGLPGSARSPQLGRSLTYNVYATTVRQYKQRNLQAAAALIAGFAQANPALFAGVVLDADTYMNPFVGGGTRFDYNPGMLKQFRHWLAGTGPYAGQGEPGTPDLSSYRRPAPLSLAEVGRMAGRQWKRWDDVDPPREFPGDEATPVPKGGKPYWDDPWHREWDSFRRHVVALHYDELAAWVAAAGIPRERIFSAQAFTAPDTGRRPVAISVHGPGPDYDSAGVSIEGAIPRAGHLGAILYGAAAENRHPLGNGRSLFATFARLDPGWGIVEYNAADLKRPDAIPEYGQTYRTLRDLFNFDGRQIALMAWNGSNGRNAGKPGYVPYTSWRNTPAEEALTDFLVDHADLPRGARLWTFGTPQHADDDGWSLERGDLRAGRGHADLEFATTAALVSPPDQVVRPADIDTLIVGLADATRLARIQVFAREHARSPWVAVTAPLTAGRLKHDAAGLRVPLAWPAALRGPNVIVEQVRIVAEFAAGTSTARVLRIALYPRNPTVH